MTQDVNAEELWGKYVKEKTQETKNELLVHYLPLVKKVVSRMMPTYDSYNDFDDMYSCGVIGLMDAIDKFEPSRDVKFEHYAKLRVRGEIIDQMRKQDWAPSSLRRKIKTIGNTFTDLEMKNGRPASDTEVAQALSMEVDDVRKTLEQSHTFNIMHFEEFLNESSMKMEPKIDEGQTPSAQFENKELTLILGKVIDSLPENERTVVSLYYFEEFTQKQIASILNVSESRVSQIHSRVLMKLRDRLKDVV